MCPNRRWLDTGAALTLEVTIFLTVTRKIKKLLRCCKTFAGTQKPFGVWLCGWPLLLHNGYLCVEENRGRPTDNVSFVHNKQPVH